MKRSGFSKDTYEIALGKAQERQARAKLRLALKTSPTRVLAQETALKEPSAAKIASQKRSKQRKAENDREEASWKLEVRTRDDYTCQFPDCGIRDLHIDVHHIAPRSQRKDLIYVESNGVCLDRSHHKWCHENQDQAVAMKLFSHRSRELAIKEGTLGIR